MWPENQNLLPPPYTFSISETLSLHGFRVQAGNMLSEVRVLGR